MSQQDLIAQLRAAEADPAELAAVLMTHFTRSEGSGREVRYGPHETPPRLTVRYAADGSIAQILRGDGVDEAELTRLQAKIERDVLAREGVMVGRKILFSARPLNGWFRYRDRFQLLPAPDEAPKSKQPFMLNPLLLETAFARTEDSNVAFMRQAAAEREIELLLSVFVGMGLSAAPRTSPIVWVMDPADPSRCLQTQQGYWWPGFGVRSDAFADTTGLHPAELEPHEDTVRRRGGISVDAPLRVPEILPWLVECYFRLPQAERDRFRRAAYWYDHAHQVWPMSRSSAYLALSRAVEAVVPDAPSRLRCVSCQSELGEGPTARFSAFVDSHTQGAISATARRRFYSVRSKLTHGNVLFLDDETSAWGSPGWMEQQSGLQMMSSVARAVLTSWLVRSPGFARSTPPAAS